MNYPRKGHPRLVAISRSPAYSPLQHQANDSAILDAAVRELEALGWSARRVTEHAVAAGSLPEADLYLNMCQGPAASQVLVAHEAMGVRFFNRPSSVLACHRHRLVPALRGSGLSFPATVLLRTDEPLGAAERADLRLLGGGPLWLKRGGVHAERPEDVVALEGVADLPRGLAEFAARGIGLAAVQVHVPGPVVKFYAVADGTPLSRVSRRRPARRSPPPTWTSPRFARWRSGPRGSCSSTSSAAMWSSTRTGAPFSSTSTTGPASPRFGTGPPARSRVTSSGPAASSAGMTDVAAHTAAPGPPVGGHLRRRSADSSRRAPSRSRCSAASPSTAARARSSTTWTATATSTCSPASAWRASATPTRGTSPRCSDQVARIHVGSFTTEHRAALVKLLAELAPGDLNRTQLYSQRRRGGGGRAPAGEVDHRQAAR